MSSVNVEKRARRIAIFSLSVAIAIAAIFGSATQIHVQAQVQTDESAVNLVNAASGKCLQPINQSHNQGDAIVQQTCNGSVAQQWTVRAVSSGKFHLINKDNGFCLDARGKAVDGTPIEQWPCNQISNENWGRGSSDNLLVSEVSGSSSYCIATPGNQDGLAMSLRQCKGDPSQTWRTEHATSAACAGSSGSSPLDLTWTNCDPNGFPFNPEWVYQVNNGGRLPPSPTSICPAASGSYHFYSTCVSWPVTYDSTFLCGPHVNYFAVTYQGPVHWWQKSSWYADDDYNFFMFPPNSGGMTGLVKPPGLEIEFDSRETINYFRSPLWKSFHDMVDNNNTAAQSYINGNTAVVTSLFGLDCAHPSCGSEEHPAYSMALNVDDSDLNDDKWAVFARNWGNEGFCSGNEYALPIGDLKLLIPWLPGATAVAVLPNRQFNLFENYANLAVAANDSRTKVTVPSPQVTIANGEGILIDFALPDASLEMGWEGEVHLQWTLPPAVRSTLVARSAARRAAAPKHPAADEEENEKPESRIANLFSKLPAQQQAAIRARTTAATQPAVARPNPPMRPVVTVTKLPPPPRLARPIAPKAVNSPQLVQRHEPVRQALCAAYKNSVPDFPSLCAAAGRGR